MFMISIDIPILGHLLSYYMVKTCSIPNMFASNPSNLGISAHRIAAPVCLICDASGPTAGRPAKQTWSPGPGGRRGRDGNWRLSRWLWDGYGLYILIIFYNYIVFLGFMVYL